MKHILIITIIFFSFGYQIIHGQTNVEKVFENIKGKYDKKEEFKVNVSYALYRGENSNKKLSSYQGVIITTDTLKYNSVSQTETFISSKYIVRVSHEEKIVLYSTDKQIISQNKKFDFLQLLDEFKTGDLKETKTNYICELITKKPLVYPYSKILIVVDKSTFAIKKQILFLKEKVNFSTTENQEEFDIVRMEITYDAILNVNKKDYLMLKIDQFISVKNKKVQLTDKYKNYQLIINN